MNAIPINGRVERSLDAPVTEHMRRDFTRLRLGQTVGDALASLREHPPAEGIIYFYVVDDEDRIQGVVPTRHLLLNPPERPLADIMVRKLVTLPAGATVRDACESFATHRFLAFPVVDADRRLLGVVDVTLYTDELGHLGDADKRDDLFQAIGVYAADAAAASPWGAFRRRFPWLGCNLAGGIVCAVLASAFEDELRRVVALALFIPVVLNLAESVSSQSVSLTLHLLRGRRPDWLLMARGLRAELPVGLLLGAACGAAVGLVALVWLRAPRVALSLLGGISGGVAAAALLGMAMPVVLRLLRLDPRVAAGPIALAAADVVTLLLYLGLARLLV
jgi:magnesium transporter